jgi:transketolase C-terminal domain/subunit
MKAQSLWKSLVSSLLENQVRDDSRLFEMGMVESRFSNAKHGYGRGGRLVRASDIENFVTGRCMTVVLSGSCRKKNELSRCKIMSMKK